MSKESLAKILRHEHIPYRISDFLGSSSSHKWQDLTVIWGFLPEQRNPNLGPGKPLGALEGSNSTHESLL